MSQKFDIKNALKFLKEDFRIPDEVLPKEAIELHSDEVIKAINQGAALEYDELNDVLSFTNDSGDRIICPDLSIGISVSAHWLLDFLPPIVFDVDQGGNTRKSSEVEAVYKLICLCHCIPAFSKDFIENIKQYDFSAMGPKDEVSGYSMTMLLKKYQDLNSTRVSSIFSAASIKLSSYREKNESYYIAQLSPEEISGLEVLRRTLKAIVSKYEKDYGLNPNDMKNMSKITKLQAIERRDVELSNEINNSRFSMIYRITKLSSERIPVAMKSRVYAKAEIGAENAVRENKLTGVSAEDLRKTVKAGIINESFRAIVKTIRYKELEKYNEDRLNYVLKVKA